MLDILRVINKYKCATLFGGLKLIKLRFKNPYSKISHRTSIKFIDFNQIKIGLRCSINDYNVIVIVDDLKNNLNNSFLEIGDDTYIGEFNNIRASGGYVKIGNNCLISQHVTLIASNHGIKKDTLIRNQPWSQISNSIVIRGYNDFLF